MENRVKLTTLAASANTNNYKRTEGTSYIEISKVGDYNWYYTDVDGQEMACTADTIDTTIPPPIPIYREEHHPVKKHILGTRLYYFTNLTGGHKLFQNICIVTLIVLFALAIMSVSFWQDIVEVPPKVQRLMDLIDMKLYHLWLRIQIKWNRITSLIRLPVRYIVEWYQSDDAPWISLFSRRQPIIMKKTMYVKSSATKKLNGNQGRKIKGLTSKSGVENIELKKKTGQPTVMYKIEASNGETYVPVHIKGSKESIEKAVVLIQEAVGEENVKEDITVSPYPPKKRSSSDHPPKIPLRKRRKEPLSSNENAFISIRSICKCVQVTSKSMYAKVANKCNTSVVEAAIALYALLYCMVYWQFDRMLFRRTTRLWLLICGMVLMIPMAVRFIVRGVSLVASWLSSLPILIFSFIRGIVMFPFDLYQIWTIQKTVYIRKSDYKIFFKGRDIQGREKKLIIKTWSGVDDIQIESANGSHVVVHLTGSRRSVWKAIGFIQEAAGEHFRWKIDQPSSSPQVQKSASSIGNVPVSEAQPIQEESTPESPVQREAINDNVNNLTKEASTTESPPAAVQEEERVPSEIGISSTQETTRETIAESSVSSIVSKTLSTGKMNENDPLLIFLRSQQSCIKGSVDEFYTWLGKSEEIDSMTVLKEAMSDDEYLNDMKIGDGGGSGIKGFKRKAFRRAILEYFNDESDIKPVDEESNKIPAAGLDEPPEELVCPISLNLMVHDPVVAADGITYERASIEDWFQKSMAKYYEAQEKMNQNSHNEADQRVVNNGVCSPVHGKKLKNLTLVPNISMRNMARAYKEKQKSST